MNKHEKAFDAAWKKLGPVMIDCCDKALDLDEAWDYDRRDLIKSILRDARHMADSDLWLIGMIMSVLAEAFQETIGTKTNGRAN